MLKLDYNVFDNGDYYDVTTGNTYLMPMEDKIKYYHLIDSVLIPNVSAHTVVEIRYHQKGDIVYFNGLMCYLNLKGGFSIKGFIELTRGYIGLSYDIYNDNNYQYIGYFIDKSYEKRKVK